MSRDPLGLALRRLFWTLLGILLLHGTAETANKSALAPLVKGSSSSSTCTNGTITVNNTAKTLSYCAAGQWQPVVSSLRFDANPTLSGAVVVASGQGLQSSQSGQSVTIACNTGSSSLIGCSAESGTAAPSTALISPSLSQSGQPSTKAFSAPAWATSAQATAGTGDASPAQFYQSETHSSTTLMYRAPANQLALTAFYLPYTLTVSNLTFRVTAADPGGGLYDLCVYDPAGNLEISTGSQSFSANGIQEVAIAQGPVTLAPGWYHFGITGTADLAAIGGDRSGAYYSPYPAGTVSVSDTTGGACPTSIVLPAVFYQSASSMPWFVLR